MADLHINNYYWSQYEDDIIREYYPKEGYKKVNEILPHRSKQSIHQHAQKLGIAYLGYNSGYFELIDSSEKAYWLGFLYADGYVTSGDRWGLELTSADKDHMQNLLNAIDCNCRIKERTRNGNNSCLFQIKNKRMYASLVNDGIVRNKTGILKFPSQEIVGRNFYADFIRGFFDGDGCCTFSERPYIRPERNNREYTALRKTVNIICKSEEFLTSIKRILEQQNINFRLYIHKQDNLFVLQTRNGDEIKKFYQYIYATSYPEIRLKRKYTKMTELVAKIGGGQNVA